MIDRMQQHFGFATMPFGRDLAPATLHRHASHTQAAARITWTVTEKTLGVITGEAGTGKTVQSAPPCRPWTPPGTPSSTSATPPPASGASTITSSPPSAAGPPTAPPP